jgi:hypothetical protein
MTIKIAGTAAIRRNFMAADICMVSVPRVWFAGPVPGARRGARRSCARICVCFRVWLCVGSRCRVAFLGGGWPSISSAKRQNHQPGSALRASSIAASWSVTNCGSPSSCAWLHAKVVLSHLRRPCAVARWSGLEGLYAEAPFHQSLPGLNAGIISSVCFFILSRKPISYGRFKRRDVYILQSFKPNAISGHARLA